MDIFSLKVQLLRKLQNECKNYKIKEKCCIFLSENVSDGDGFNFSHHKDLWREVFH